MSQASDENLVKSEAADWVLRCEAGRLSPAEAEALEAWLARSPRHQQLYTSTTSCWRAAEQLGGHPRMAAMRRWALRESARAQLVRRCVAAGFAAVIIGAGGAVGHGFYSGPKPLASQAFATAVGQRATVTLPDGSAVTLNTDTQVRTVADRDKRIAYLDRGQAFFKVAKDRRHPFVVVAAGRTVTALGTAFEVRVDGDTVKVVLVEGRVRVESPAPAGPRAQATATAPSPALGGAPIATDMSAGSQLIATNSADWRVTSVNARRETSWLTGQIIVDDESLGEVVAELNRYSARKMVFADRELEQRRVSGVFTPGDIQAFSLALRDAKMADIEDGDGGPVKIVPFR